MEAIGTLFVTIGIVSLIMLYSSLSWGYVIFTLYNWFILPTFPTLPYISILGFIGIYLFVNSIINVSQTHIKDEYKDKTMAYASLFLNPWLTLGFSWLVKVMLF